MKFVVVGSGIAGLNFALKASALGEVILITKKELVESNTNYAQGGIAAVLDKSDSISAHIKDTLLAGAGLCDKEAVTVMAKNAADEIKNLLNLGVGFDRKIDGSLDLTREGGHHMRRIAFAKDATGREIELTLAKHVRKNKSITILEEHIAYELIKSENRISAIAVFDQSTNRIKTFEADMFILATGGCNQAYARTSNPKIATGDGIAMAYKAGVSLVDLEFIQFHPTAFDKDNHPQFLISETLRGEGGVLRNAKGSRFMGRYHKMKELAPRDIVARAIMQESEKGQVYLDMTALKEAYLKKRFPTIYERLWWYGLKMEKEAIPIAPVAHYSCGGIQTDTYSQTNIPNLFAFGEVACTGVHGANRLASNSLMESLVFGVRAFEKIEKMKGRKSKAVKKKKFVHTINRHREIKKLEAIEKALRRVMWKKVGVWREEIGLKAASNKLKKLEEDFLEIKKKGLNKTVIRVENLLIVASLIVKAVSLREESRGTHYRLDFPKKSKAWEKRIVLTGEEISFEDVR